MNLSKKPDQTNEAAFGYPTTTEGNETYQEPTHCHQCGDVMVKGKITPWINAYNSDGSPTGETQHTLKCRTQTRAWWKRIFDLSYHKEFLVIHHPNETRDFLKTTILTTIRTF